MSHDYSCFIDTRGWDVDEDGETPTSNSYRILARSLEKNSHRYVQRSNKKTVKQNKRTIQLPKRQMLSINKSKRVPSQQNQLPPIPQVQILVVKTIDMDPKNKLQYDWQQKSRRFFKVNLLPWPKNAQIGEREEQDLLLKESNRKYDKIREHRANKNSRRLYFHFKSREEMEAATQKSIQKYLLQRHTKQNQQAKNIFCLPVLNK